MAPAARARTTPRHAGAAAAVVVSLLVAPTAVRAAAPPPRVALSSLTAQGFEIKAVSGNQSGVIGTLVLQKGKDVFLCEAKDLSIEPTAFECWPVK